MSPAPQLGPIDARSRIGVLDAMRGVALLGIMFVNMTWFTGYAVLDGDARVTLGTAGVDGVTEWLVHVLVDGKFWSLFALLFGIGFALQTRRAERLGRDATLHLVRRMSVLLLIGLAHAVFIWFGDIVSLYAVVGLVLIPFAARRPAALMRWAAAMLLAPIPLALGWLALEVATRTPGAAAVDPGHGPAAMLVQFSDGGYRGALEANWAFLVERWFLAAYSGRFLTLLGMFLLGVWAVRVGVVDAPRRHRRLLVGVVAVGVLIGLPANAALAAFPVPLRPPTAEGCLAVAARTVGTPALALAYAAALVLVYQRSPGRRLLSPFAYAGRLSLTSYVLQSIVGVTLFYGYGLGWWGRFGITWSIPLILGIFALLSMASAAWLHRFAFGPLEWCWRCLTYMRVMPIRRAGALADARRVEVEVVR